MRSRRSIRPATWQRCGDTGVRRKRLLLASPSTSSELVATTAARCEPRTKEEPTMSRLVSLAGRITLTLFPLLAVSGALLVAPRSARADGGCKPDGRQCATNISCCSGHCMKPTVTHGRALFGTCCTPTTCTAAGANCGTIPDGDCGGTLNCGTCTAPDTCGGGGVANQCGCTPATTCPDGDNCGTASDGCGGTLSCGTCTDGQVCGSTAVSEQACCYPSGTMGVCTASNFDTVCCTGTLGVGCTIATGTCFAV